MALPLLAIGGITVILGLLISQKNFIQSAYSTTKAALYRIPNSIMQIIENPCDQPWSVLVKTAREPGLNLIIALTTFGMDDVIRGAVRPKQVRGKPHLRRGGKSGRKSQGIPELGEIVGKNIPGATTLGGRAVNIAEGILWQADNVIQRGAWNWFVVQLADDFTYEWASAIERSHTCEAEKYGRFRLALDAEKNYKPINPALSMPIDYSNITIDANSAIFHTNHHEGYIVVSLLGFCINTAGAPWFIEIRQEVGTESVLVTRQVFGVDFQLPFQVTVGAQIQRAATRVRVIWGTVNINFGNAEFNGLPGSQIWGMLYPNSDDDFPPT